MTHHAILVALFALTPSFALAQCESLYDEDLGEHTWVRYQDTRYSICYGVQYDQDAELTRTWVDNAFQIAENKYEVVAPVHRRGYDLNITIFLVPFSTSRANSHTATVTCCSDSMSLEIHIMSPSAPDYGQDLDHFIKVLTHEMMNTLHYEAREPPNISPPLWIREGLAEYEGYCNTTPANEDKLDWLAKYVYDEKLQDIYYGSNLADRTPTIVSADRYRGSAVVMYFLAVQFGEKIHHELFQRPLNAVLWEHRVTARWVFEGLDYWMDEVGRSDNTSWTCPRESLDARSSIGNRKEIRNVTHTDVPIRHNDNVEVITHTDTGIPHSDHSDTPPPPSHHDDRDTEGPHDTPGDDDVG